MKIATLYVMNSFVKIIGAKYRVLSSSSVLCNSLFSFLLLNEIILGSRGHRMLLKIRFVKGIAPVGVWEISSTQSYFSSCKTQCSQWKNSKQFLYVLEEYITPSCMHKNPSDINVFEIKKAKIVT